MQNSIWKFQLLISDHPGIYMPVGAEILCVQIQGGQPHVWALVDADAPKEVRHFRVIGTGHPVEGDPGEYVGTFQARDGGLVFHVFVDPGRTG